MHGWLRESNYTWTNHECLGPAALMHKNDVTMMGKQADPHRSASYLRHFSEYVALRSLGFQERIEDEAVSGISVQKTHVSAYIHIYTHMYMRIFSCINPCACSCVYDFMRDTNTHTQKNTPYKSLTCA